MVRKENQRITLTRRLLQEGLLRLLRTEKLEDIRDALLKGYIEKEKLLDIAKLINDHKVESADPKLQEIMAEIELRVEVELAKLTR